MAYRFYMFGYAAGYRANEMGDLVRTAHACSGTFACIAA